MNTFINLVAFRTPLEVILFVICCLLLGLWLVSSRLNFYLGVNDGYGYAREPWNPGYKKAGVWLRKHAAYKWPEVMRLDAIPNPSDPDTAPKSKDWIESEFPKDPL